MRLTLVSAAICAGAAALEGVAAGRDVRARFAELQQPRFSPPLAMWIAIGLGYYVVCFVVLQRLLSLDSASTQRTVALGLLIAAMLINAAWGWPVFRLKNMRASYLTYLPYGIIILALATLLLRIDPGSALVLLPYLVYLIYAAWWGRALWRLNGAPGVGREQPGT